ncbi:hypothetical protein CKAN_00241100 [Cinnamomum micranthum f. kanehirae]|uniref:Uncharacterized protein n=1 Tax=Cinnamomum micranthum f. kanehirae TaxID=337451 RepID=A0A3S3MSM7_9MAGN|nr:hypothetical protein CKAN_00241100 [Cinnamomum micranthum f. kanehirae]
MDRQQGRCSANKSESNSNDSNFKAFPFTLFWKPKDSIIWICKIKDKNLISPGF